MYLNTYHYFLLTIFCILAYMIIVDKNVSSYIILLFKIFRINVERFIWMVKYHPNNFITTWIQNKKYENIAKELEKKYKNTI